MNHMPYLTGRAYRMLAILWGVFIFPCIGLAQESTAASRLQSTQSALLEQSEKSQSALIERLGNRAETRTRLLLLTCGVLFFVGAYCGHWAQNNYRNPLVWFFAGFFLNVAAVGAILWMQHRSRRRKRYRRVMAYWHF